jgi:hypothetical protein
VTDQQPRLPGWCWTCNGHRWVEVAVTVRGQDGYPECLAWRTACPDCQVSPGRRRWAEAVRSMLPGDELE